MAICDFSKAYKYCKHRVKARKASGRGYVLSAYAMPNYLAFQESEPLRHAAICGTLYISRGRLNSRRSAREEL